MKVQVHNAKINLSSCLSKQHSELQAKPGQSFVHCFFVPLQPRLLLLERKSEGATLRLRGATFCRPEWTGTAGCWPLGHCAGSTTGQSVRSTALHVHLYVHAFVCLWNLFFLSSWSSFLVHILPPLIYCNCIESFPSPRLPICHGKRRKGCLKTHSTFCKSRLLNY